MDGSAELSATYRSAVQSASTNSWRISLHDNGAFANTPAHELGAVAIKAALERAKVDGGEVDEVILGQILSAGQGQNPARQAAMAAGVPKEKTAWGLNQLCGSGLRTVAIGLQQIANGDAAVIVAGTVCRSRWTRTPLMRSWAETRHR